MPNIEVEKGLRIPFSKTKRNHSFVYTNKDIEILSTQVWRMFFAFYNTEPERIKFVDKKQLILISNILLHPC